MMMKIVFISWLNAKILEETIMIQFWCNISSRCIFTFAGWNHSLITIFNIIFLSLVLCFSRSTTNQECYFGKLWICSPLPLPARNYLWSNGVVWRAQHITFNELSVNTSTFIDLLKRVWTRDIVLEGGGRYVNHFVYTTYLCEHGWDRTKKGEKEQTDGGWCEWSNWDELGNWSINLYSSELNIDESRD